jgi:hypothetical protein
MIRQITLAFDFFDSVCGRWKKLHNASGHRSYFGTQPTVQGKDKLTIALSVETGI